MSLPNALFTICFNIKGIIQSPLIQRAYGIRISSHRKSQHLNEKERDELDFVFNPKEYYNSLTNSNKDRNEASIDRISASLRAIRTMTKMVSQYIKPQDEIGHEILHNIGIQADGIEFELSQLLNSVMNRNKDQSFENFPNSQERPQNFDVEAFVSINDYENDSSKNEPSDAYLDIKSTDVQVFTISVTAQDSTASDENIKKSEAIVEIIDNEFWDANKQESTINFSSTNSVPTKQKKKKNRPKE